MRCLSDAGSDCQPVRSCPTVGISSKTYQYTIQFSGWRSRCATQVSKRTIVITGASDGVGAAAARRLTATGNELGAEYLCADFSYLAQVRFLADELRQRYPRIDVLANNAGSVFAADGLT